MDNKLLTLKETAELLGLSEEEVRRLAEIGKIPAYHIGGMYLRFKEEQILSFKTAPLDKGQKVRAEKTAAISSENDPFISKIKDFFYFNDFYIISALFIAALLYIILKSIR